jgi:hypothetical protein
MEALRTLLLCGGVSFLSNEKFLLADSNSRSDRKWRLCRWAGALFLLVGMLHALAGFASATLPPGHKVVCSAAGGCSTTLDATFPFDAPTWNRVRQDFTSKAKFDSYAAQPAVRVTNGLLVLLKSWPLALLLAFIAMALFRLGEGRSSLIRATLWVRAAAVAALVTAMIPPLVPSLQASLLMAGTPQGPGWVLALDVRAFLDGLLLASAATAVAWALTAANKAQAELDRFV